jgi:hypothetical protein
MWARPDHGRQDADAEGVQRGGERWAVRHAVLKAHHQHVEPGRYCSPRRRMPFNSRNESLKYVSMTRRAISTRALPVRLS